MFTYLEYRVCVCDVCICDCVFGGCARRCVWCVNVRCFIHSWDHEFNKSLGTSCNIRWNSASYLMQFITPPLPPILSPHIFTLKAMCKCVEKPLPVFCPLVWLHSDSIFMSALFSHRFHINNFSANTIYGSMNISLASISQIFVVQCTHARTQKH